MGVGSSRRGVGDRKGDAGNTKWRPFWFYGHPVSPCLPPQWWAFGGGVDYTFYVCFAVEYDEAGRGDHATHRGNCCPAKLHFSEGVAHWLECVQAVQQPGWHSDVEETPVFSPFFLHCFIKAILKSLLISITITFKAGYIMCFPLEFSSNLFFLSWHFKIYLVLK